MKSSAPKAAAKPAGKKGGSKKQPAPVIAPALLITSDAPVSLTLDGQSAGHLNADQPQRFVLALGEHQVLARSDVEGVEFRSTVKLTQPGDLPLAVTLAAQITKKQTPAPAADPDAEEEVPAPVHTGPQVMPGDFVMVAELDSEPRPLSKAELSVPNSAKGKVVNGFIIVLANIDEHGAVTDASLMRGLEVDYGLNQAAVEAAKKARFTPGIKNGVPVKTAKSLTYKIVSQ